MGQTYAKQRGECATEDKQIVISWAEVQGRQFNTPSTTITNPKDVDDFFDQAYELVDSFVNNRLSNISMIEFINYKSGEFNDKLFKDILTRIESLCLGKQVERHRHVNAVHVAIFPIGLLSDEKQRHIQDKLDASFNCYGVPFGQAV